MPQVARMLAKPGLSPKVSRNMSARSMASFPAQRNLFRFTKQRGAVAADSFRRRTPLRNRLGIFPFRSRQRRGIFIGTREFGVPSRNHFLAISSVLKLGQPVTVINTEGWSGARLLRAISRDLHIVSGKLPYTAYLCLMARHRIVFQLDRSAVPGQVAGDALLCGLPCVGGDGAVDKLAFPGLCGIGLPAESAVSAAERLLADDIYYAETLEKSRELALDAPQLLQGKRPVAFRT